MIANNDKSIEDKQKRLKMLSESIDDTVALDMQFRILRIAATIHTPTWKKVVAALMQDCDSDPKVPHQLGLPRRISQKQADRQVAVCLFCEPGTGS